VLKAFIVISILGILFYFTLAPFGKSVYISGTVESFNNNPSETQSRIVIIKLDDGKMVWANAGDDFNFRKGHRAMVKEKTQHYFGAKDYHFIKYIEK
jgi:hypothetical protein